MGPNILITGASSGMGYETVRLFAEKGYRVFATTRDPGQLQEKLSAEGIEGVEVLLADLHSYASAREAVATVLDKAGTIDILVNNAGYGLVSTLEEVTEEEMIDQFQINLFGLVRMTQEVLPAMREKRSGIIVNISSFLGRVGLPLLSFYNASKYAVEGMTDSLRLELAGWNIRVHSVMPGFFDTQFARRNLRVNAAIRDPDSPYATLTETLAPRVIRQINEGNDPRLVAEAILQIVEDPDAPVRVAVGEMARRFLTMRRELSDKEYERRVMEYYGIGEA
ncbi:SDR family oxidoreductase [Nitratifractor sp.]|uniref:SDR family oxidoreductase n=1 Tax=Nitratifractor sp. TaxID=2268144 RepID=UPI0025E8544F|nr:SDR family oxidoreductase [Nitratifractor sp.]